MKNKFFLGLLHFFVMSHCSDQELFLKANRAYNNKEYKVAFDLYQKIQSKGVAAWYNMGNAAYKLSDYPHARVCWLCAEPGASSQERAAIQTNIDIVEGKLGIQKNAEDQGVLSHIKNFFLNFSLLFLQIAFLISWFLFFHFIKKNNHGTKYRTLMLGLLLILNVFFILVLVLKYSDKQNKGIVMKENSTLFAGPNEQFHALGTVPVASKVTVLEHSNNWCKVKDAKQCGWMLADSITVL